MNVSARSIRRPLPAVLLFLALCIGGLVGFGSLPVTELPVVEIPQIVVDAQWPGTPAGQVERELTRVIEQAVAGTGRVRHVLSQVSEGQSHTTIEFEPERKRADALDAVRAAVARVRDRLPPGVRDPVVRADGTENLMFLLVVSSTRRDALDLSRFVDTELNRALAAVPGVGSVKRQGGAAREIEVGLDPVALRALHLDAGTVAGQVAGLVEDTQAGRIALDGTERPLQWRASATGVAALADASLSLKEGRAVRLADLASVRDTAARPTELALLDGRPVIGVQVMQREDADETRAARGVQAAVAALRAAHPDIAIDTFTDNVAPVDEVYRHAMRALYEGCALAVVVVWLFLRDWRATLVSAAALPLSVVPTFLVLAWLGFSLNQLTMLALILVIGVLVDDAIVEVENIARHLAMGKSPRQAAFDAAEEIGMAVIATSLTLVAVFLPTSFMTGTVGRYFMQFGWTAAAAVLVSLGVARLLTPAMAARYLRPAAHAPREGRLMARYLKAVNWCLGHPWRCAAGGLVFVLASVAALAALPQSFFPQEDGTQIIVDVASDPGSGLAATREAAEAARRASAGIDEIASVYTTVGAAGDAGAADTARLTLALKPLAERKRSQTEIEELLRRRFALVPGARVTIDDSRAARSTAVVLAGRDGAALDAAAREVERAIRLAPGLGYVSSAAGSPRPTLAIAVDSARAAALGVSVDTAARAIRAATGGGEAADLPQLNLAGTRVPVRVALATQAGGADAASLLAGLSIPGANGELPLASVARVLRASEAGRIERRDGERVVTLDVALNGRPLDQVAAQLDTLPALQRLPAGVHRGLGNDAQSLAELFGGFYQAMLFGLICIYAILVLLFGGFVLPATVLVALPLSLGGAAAALALLPGLGLSLASLVGVLMLMGLSTKNAILLVEHVQIARRGSDISRAEAIVDACRKRARPIVMTTLAMMAGLLPLALDMRGDAFRSSMAVTVIGGLVSSTLLSLLLVPVAFMLLDRGQARLARLLHRPPRPSPSPLASRHEAPAQAGGEAGREAGVAQAARASREPA
ncbi:MULTISPECIES: efflux RND transporter permease subunit [Burkholderia]|uniref:efflux RND transporter permease subunit n=1 Tax=Burkholderia TaxID=32008 RepID=UPI00119B8AEE|nr:MULTISPECIES: efflux RND transporter permease subunit [Burkholderia]MDN7741194.1 efflux RND transporter permease subunit [Burkholderia gladioli]TWC70415.1 multidrug efflux pump subunit AcrB [Burkholderia sp. SJZ089]TWD01678.1 multidrug efflux pump subunit AcrB [Burkholderia sp. SJZ115]TWD06004.1 multidrug efflux pump subunit AcrB [Burkholderia sp. SJZ091]